MGGLGNQMFQYATSRAIALRLDSELVLDNWSGFISDYKYRRSYELGDFPIQARSATIGERLPFWIEKLESLLLRNRVLIREKIYGSIISEVDKKFFHELCLYETKRNCWLTGYWHSPNYFLNYESHILNELTPPLPKNTNYLDLAQEIKGKTSVALGIRLYEETKEPASHARNEEVKSIHDINNAINIIRQKLDEPYFYIFSTRRSNFLLDLDLLPWETKFVTRDDGFESSTQVLWLLTQFPNHIITNSSFYWWGAWLSQRNYIKTSQIILAANNFMNKDALPDNWLSY